MKLISIYQPSYIIPSSFFYCDDVIETDDGLEVIVDGKMIATITEFAHYTIYDDITADDEENIVPIIRRFIDSLDQLVK
jgi:hypothetical protein